MFLCGNCVGLAHCLHNFNVRSRLLMVKFRSISVSLVIGNSLNSCEYGNSHKLIIEINRFFVMVSFVCACCRVTQFFNNKTKYSENHPAFNVPALQLFNLTPWAIFSRKNCFMTQRRRVSRELTKINSTKTGRP